MSSNEQAFKAIVTKQLSFTVEEYQQRLAGVRARMQQREADLFLSHTPENIYYLSGYRTPGYYRYQCLALAHQGNPVLLTRRLEQPNVWAYSWFDDSASYLDTEDPIELTARVIEDLGGASRTIGVEKNSWFLTVQDFERLQRRLPNARFVDLSGTVEEGRLIKSPAEVGYMRRAARAAERAMQAGIEAVREGSNENQMAAAIWGGLVLGGSEYAGLPPFVVTGPRTLIPHATWSGRSIQRGEPWYFEIGATVHRYAAAFSRSGSLGTPSDEVRRMGDATAQALEALIANIKPGMTGSEVNALGQQVFAECGFPGVQTHRLAYSIGINFPPDWGEGQIMSLQNGEERPLRPGMTFHLIPSLFKLDVAGVICTETVLVTETGAESLFQFERRFFEC